MASRAKKMSKTHLESRISRLKEIKKNIEKERITEVMLEKNRIQVKILKDRINNNVIEAMKYIRAQMTILKYYRRAKERKRVARELEYTRNEAICCTMDDFNQ
jgi:hypothetical protein